MADSETGDRMDKELEEFRNLMQVPDSFDEGFRWSSLLGALFIGLIMVPGSLYMGLLAGQGIGPAAQWVTVILFIEVAKRAQQNLKKAEIFVLYWMAGAAMGAPFSGLLWSQFFVRSDAAMKTGVAESIPTWVAPAADSTSYAMRSFFHHDWLWAIGLVIFSTFMSKLAEMVLGYGLFRLTSDIEKLPFPMAPIGAQGILALAEDSDIKSQDDREKNWRWRVFSIGGALGLAFGTIYLLLPTVSGALTGKPVTIFPIPFVDWTTKTQAVLPAVATGLEFDMIHVIIGMVLPFWAMVGSFIGLIITMVANPVLYKFGILQSWQPGDDTVQTLFKNNVDFYFSFQIGVAIAVFVAGVWQVARNLQRSKKKRKNSISGPSTAVVIPAGRGDIKPFWIVLTYIFTTMSYIVVCGYLIDWHPMVMVMLFILGFVITPLISYVTARLEGIAGQVVDIPMVKEAAMIFSGYHGVAVWFLPVPIANYGTMTMFYRTSELLGTRFTSLWKAQFFMYPIILVSSIVFANFIWSLAPIPSAVYPYANKMWELNAANSCIMYSSTLGEYSQFEEAWNWVNFGSGAGFGLALFGVLGAFNAPVFLIYGVVRGLGQSMPHSILPQFFGALLGQFYFRRRYGDMWRKYIPVIAAGFACGEGLVTVLGVGFTFLSKAVVQLPF